MVEKRKRSSATTHVRASSAASQSTTPVPQSTPPVTVAQPEIPTSFVKDGPLPVISARQPDDLSLKDFKSVAESKVLAESLARSQRRWADGDIFERVWIKPLKSRKLNPADVERNLSKESMVRLGACTMTCMPHQFDMKLWALVQPVKAPPPQTPPPPPPLPPPSQSQVTYHQQPPQGTALQPIQQAGPSHPQQAPVALPNPQGQSVSTPQRQAPQAVATITPVQIPRPPASVPQIPQPNGAAPVTPNSSIVPKTVPTPQSNLVAPSPQQQPQPQPQQVQRHTVTHAQLPPPPTPATALPPRQTIATPQRPPPQHIQPPPASPHPPQGPQGPPPPQNARSGPDPVIQMLAMKAATDQNLKQLMRIVASGRATKEQLQEFQGHIDILTSESNLNNQQSQGPPPPPPPGQPPPGQMYHHSQQPPPHQMMPHPMYQQPPHPQQMYQQPHPQYQQYPQHGQQRPAQYQQPPPPKPRAFPQAPKQEVVGVLLEFVDNYSHGDRFLFPKHAILEYLDGGTTLRASFIVTQKLSEGSTDEYYQPTTVIFKASTAKTLETFGKVVADPETTRTHMKEVMSKMKRAEDTFLVYRLRREPGEPVPSKASVETKMPPPTRHRKRDVSTPNVDTIRSSASNAQSSTASRPRVKNVKKVQTYLSQLR
ncbi:hypothetical protein EDC01DRAFT_643737 [Geopyxis carbonaria]|nr:hypothetical protein EDC01DRAFT_643737 [Geopyxis carbonaria]